MERREARCELIAQAREHADTISDSERVWKVVRLPPELAAGKLQQRERIVSIQQPERIIG